MIGAAVAGALYLPTMQALVWAVSAATSGRTGSLGSALVIGVLLQIAPTLQRSVRPAA